MQSITNPSLKKNASIGKEGFDISPEPNLSQYSLGEVLGEGSFGKVRIANHVLTDERVAIKQIKIENPSTRAMIEREISILNQLHHPNIIKVYAVIKENENTISIIQEYCNGKDLLKYINKKQKLPEEEACSFFMQILSGVKI